MYIKHYVLFFVCFVFTDQSKLSPTSHDAHSMTEALKSITVKLVITFTLCTS